MKRETLATRRTAVTASRAAYDKTLASLGHIERWAEGAGMTRDQALVRVTLQQFEHELYEAGVLPK